MRRTFLALFVVALAGCQTMAAPDEIRAEVRLALQNWATAFNACDSNGLTMLYDTEAVLWGTVAPTIIDSPTGVRQYFERACSAKPQPKVAIGEQHLRVYGDTAVNSGTYTFTVFPGGQPRQFPARYSFTYRKKDGEWLIVTHHSSARPNPPTQLSTLGRQ